MSETQSSLDSKSPEVEHKHHHYVGSRIPWYVRLIWIGFWIFAIYYTIRYLVPALRLELFSVQ